MTMLSNSQLDQIAKDIPFIESWLSAVKAEITTAIEQGIEFRNARLVPTRPTRKWFDQEHILETLLKFSTLDIVAPRSAVSPSQAEKILGKAFFKKELSGAIVSESSGMKLAFSTEELEN